MSRKINERPKYVQSIVDEANQRFRQQKMKDNDTNELFWFILDFLLKRNMYRGYNFYIDRFDENKGIHVPALAGTADPSKYDYIQIW